MAALAVPAYRGWVTKSQPDGTTITVRQGGDEFYHYWENEAGQQVRQDADGYWQVVGNSPTPATVAERRASNPIYRSKMAAMDANGANGPARVGKLNLAPRGLVILVNFQNVSFRSANTLEAMTEMMNGASYSYGTGCVGSVKKYFSDQSNGQYVPTFDVVGPVTVSQNRAYYGGNDSNGDDKNPEAMILEACQLAYSQYSVNFSLYDNDNNGEVDFVYVIYAGDGEADGGADETIWPHNFYLQYAYTATQRTIGGKKINNYACSGELRGGSTTRNGIGTLCHEFGHVIGLPDYYDTNYGYNYKNNLTPGDWSVMDGGSYNNNGITPPNYSIYDKYYMGWCTPTNLHAAAEITMGTTYGEGYQINNAGSLAAATATATQYYIENRQKSGWDSYLPGHGMIVWQVKYNSTAWTGNTPNNTANDPRYTVVSASGNAAVQGDLNDPFPGKGKKTSYTPFSQYPLLNITENTTNGTISFIFIKSPDCHPVEVSGTNCTINPSETCVQNGAQLTANIVPADDSYDVTSVVVKLGSTTLTSGTHYTLSNNFLTIKGTAITGDAANKLTITATAVKNRWNYEVAYENATVSSESGTVNKGGALNLTITPSLGYIINSGEHLEVSMGGSELTYGTGFTYNAGTGAFSISRVTGDVEIYVMPAVDPMNLATFVPLSDVAMLNAGQKCILVYTTTPAVAGTTLAGGYFNSVTSGFTENNGAIEVPLTSTTVNIFTLGGSAGAWTLMKDGQYLKATASDFSWTATNTTWTIAVTGSGNTELKCGGNQVYYNSSSPRFKPYSNAQAAIKMYVTYSGEKKTNTVTFDNAGNHSMKVNGVFTNAASATYGTVAYSSSNTAVATVDYKGVITPKTAGTTTITASVEEGAYYTAAQAQYTLTVDALERYTITWKNGGSTFTTTNVTEGETLALPGSKPADCTEREFVGWTTSSSYNHATTAPTMVSGGEEIDGAQTYYAVFAKATGGITEKTTSKTSFAAVNADMDDYISYEAQKGSAGTAPAVNSEEIRIYQNGGLLVINAKTGATIKSVTIGSSMATQVQYAIGAGAYNGANQSISAGGSYTLSEQSTSKITFKCMGTTSSARLYLNNLSVTYEVNGTTYTYYNTTCADAIAGKTTPSFSFETGSKQMVIDETWTQTVTTNTDGAVTYASSDETIASVNASSGLVTAKKSGSVTITANGAEGATYAAASASYSVTVVRKTASPSFASANHSLTAKGQTYTQTVTTGGHTGTVTYSSSDAEVATVNVSSGQVTAVANGTTTITANLAQNATYNAASASYTITVSGIDDSGSTGGACTGKKIDSDYYESLDGLSGQALFDAIHLVAKKGYKSLSYDGLWTAYCAIDVDASGYVIDFYNDASQFVCGGSAQGANASGVGQGYNREHSIPKSWFGGSTSANTPGTDLFHLVPTDVYTNSQRSNLAYGEVSSASWTSPTGGGKVGTAMTIDGQTCSSKVFEPMDKYKGDLARGYLGAMLRWAGDYQTFTEDDGAKIFTTTYTDGNYGLTAYGKALLLKWCAQDPVSQKEIDRNDGIQEQQGNRNPFIDYPELIDYLWGAKAGQTFTISTSDGTFCEDYIIDDSGDEKTYYTITWSRDGVETAQSDVLAGSKLVLEDADDCTNGREFLGWSATPVSQTDVRPTYVTAGGLVNGDVTYYAVYGTADAPASAPKKAVAEGLIWSENFNGFEASAVPTAPGTGAYVVDGATISYACEAGGTSTKIFAETMAGGSSPELLISKGNGTFTIDGIPSKGATEMQLTFKMGSNGTMAVSSGTSNVSVTGSGSDWTISIGSGVTTFDIEIKNTHASKNARIDDLSLAITAGGGGELTSYSQYSTSCATTSVVPTFAFEKTSVTVAYDGEVVNTLSNSSDGEVSYTSSNTSVATIAADGTVTIVGVGGPVTISASVPATATYQAANASYTLTVTKATPTIQFEYSSRTVNKGKTVSNVATASVAGSISYTSASTGIATGNDEGVATGVAAGETTITATLAATANYNSVNTSYTLTVMDETEYTVRWMVNGVTLRTYTESVQEGNKPTAMPGRPGNINCDYPQDVFIGWTTDPAKAGHQDVAPTPLYKSLDEIPAVSGNVTYYAVFGEE